VSKTKSKQLKSKLLEGRILAIDPSSGGISKYGAGSQCGWAIFNKGQLEDSGIIMMDHGKPKEIRLKKLGDCLRLEFGDTFDVLVIEKIASGRMTHESLINACGAFMSNLDADSMIEVNVKSWQAIASRAGGWKKDDEYDAIYIGLATIFWASGYDQAKKEPEKMEKIEEIVKSFDFWGITEMEEVWERKKQLTQI